MPAEAEDAANLPQASDARERAHHDHLDEDGSNHADRLAAALDGDDDVNDSELEAVDISVDNKSDWVSRMPQMNLR